MKTFDQCCQAVAEKHGRSSFIAEIYDRARPESKYSVMEVVEEAATLYANEKLKGMLEVAKQEAAQWQTKSDKENDISNKAAYSMTAYAVNRIATRIEEMINETK